MNKNVPFSELLINSLEEKCSKHARKYQYIAYAPNKQLQFLCQQCDHHHNDQYFKLTIKDMLQQPILFTIIAKNHPNKQNNNFIKFFLNLSQCSQNGKYSSCQNQYKLLEKFLQIWQYQFKQLCNQILQQYKEYIEENSNNSLIKITQTSKNYRQQFQQLCLESNRSITIQYLQDVIRSFVQKNSKYDPLPALQQSLENFRQEINFRKKVNWKYVTNLYREFMGNQKWNTQSILQPLIHRSTTLQEIVPKYAMPDDYFQLSQSNRSIYYNSTNNQLLLYKTNSSISEVKIFDISELSGISLRSAEQNSILQPISKLEIGISIDYIQQINSYRLIGINYNQILIINYCFDKLQIISRIPISGVVQVHNHKQCLYIVANSKLLKVNLQCHPQLPSQKQYSYDVINLDCTKIKILQKQQIQFLQITNQDGNTKQIVCK